MRMLAEGCVETRKFRRFRSVLRKFCGRRNHGGLLKMPFGMGSPHPPRIPHDSPPRGKGVASRGGKSRPPGGRAGGCRGSVAVGGSGVLGLVATAAIHGPMSSLLVEAWFFLMTVKMSAVNVPRL